MLRRPSTLRFSFEAPIQLIVVEAEHISDLGTRSAKVCVDAREEFPDTERFGDVIVGAEV